MTLGVFEALLLLIAWVIGVAGFAVRGVLRWRRRSALSPLAKALSVLADHHRA